jgi:hypothetical protein
VEDAIALVLQVMSTTMDSTALGNEKCGPHLCRLTRSFARICYFNSRPRNEGAEVEIYRPAEVGAPLKTHDLTKKDEDTEMKIARSVFASGLYWSLTLCRKICRRHPSRPWNCLESTSGG